MMFLDRYAHPLSESMKLLSTTAVGLAAGALLTACSSSNSSLATTQDLERAAREISMAIGETPRPMVDTGSTVPAGMESAAEATAQTAESAVQALEAAALELEQFSDELEQELSDDADTAVDATTEQAEATLEDVTPGAANALAIRTEGPAIVGEIAPEFTLRDQAGTAHSLSDFRGTPVVLEWFNHGCPFVRKHYGTDNMQGLQARYTEAGAVWLSICSSAEGKQGFTAQDDLTALVEQHGMASTAVMADADGAVGRLYGARNTPQMFVVDAAGLLVYGGAIDDNSSSSPSTVEGANNDVAEVLDALLAGEQVEPRETQPYGCAVKY